MHEVIMVIKHKKILVLFLFSLIACSVNAEEVGVWNSFGQQNVIECYNLSGSSKRFTLDLKNDHSKTIFQKVIDIQALDTVHIMLPEYLASQYGTYRVDTADVRCLTMFYKMSEKVEYAYALAMSEPLQGESHGVFNSINPKGGKTPTANWLSIYNAGEEFFHAYVSIYKQDGSYDEEHSFRILNLEPGERKDLALGHEYGQVVGSYTITPFSDDFQYGAYVTRYSEEFAFPLLAKKGAANFKPVYVSTMANADNYLEIANPNSEEARVQILVTEQSGKQTTEIANIPAHSQVHFYVNRYISANNLGSVQVFSLTGSKLLVQSLFYNETWAYASQAEALSEEQIKEVSFPVNTFLNASNWALVLKEDGIVQTNALHEIYGENATSLHSFLAGENLSVHTEALRVFYGENGVADYIMNIPSFKIKAEAVEEEVAYFRVQEHDGSFVIKLTDAEQIAHARSILADAKAFPRNVAGKVVKEEADYNQPLSFHLSDISFFEVSISLCQSTARLVEQNLDFVGSLYLPDGQFCSLGEIVEEIIF